jgi:hypothetical protein
LLGGEFHPADGDVWVREYGLAQAEGIEVGQAALFAVPPGILRGVHIYLELLRKKKKRTVCSGA